MTAALLALLPVFVLLILALAALLLRGSRLVWMVFVVVHASARPRAGGGHGRRDRGVRPHVNASCDPESDVREEAVDRFVDALLDDDAEQLYERAPCGYLSTTPDGTIVKVNATSLTLTGYTREQLVGRRRFVDLLTGGGRIYHETHYAPMLRMQGHARAIALDVPRDDIALLALTPA